MGFINVAERTINAKLVYYGVGVGGKTTSLQQVHGILCPRNEVQLVSINTEEDSTLLFDFLPINLGHVGGFKIRIQGFTVPGQPKYRQMRKYVLQGADAVVFVVDSQRSRLQENVESLQSMRDNLRSSPGTSEDVPIVVQYNKRDLGDILTEEELDREFRFRSDIPSFPSVATEGHGVFEAFVEAVSMLVERKVALYGLGRDRASPSDVANGVRQKLWSICDEVRRSRTVVGIADLPQQRLAVPDAPEVPTATSSEEPPAPASASPAESATAGDASGSQGASSGEEDFDLTYELRETSGAQPSQPSQVITDAELDLALGEGLEPAAAPRVEEADPLLFDKTVQSNLELARRFGELDEKRLLLERKVQELVDVAQQTVHDLNRPLSAMRLMLATIDKGYLGEVAAPVKQAVQNGLLACSQMERLVRDLLDSSRLDHDGVHLQFAECDLTLLLADVLRTLRYEIEERDVRIRIEPMPVVRADAWALTKVFMNLLGNAINYSASERPASIRVFAEDRGDEWLVGVRDNGIGIPEADRGRLFRRFERGSNTGGISGTGLGLHIVKEIVQGHGGMVSFDSAVGDGTTFWLHLPKVPVQAPHSSVSATAELCDL
ncbi:MAG: ATP-binding protein [Planctomycetota bacterium]|jgi:signal transduction histidine kinase/signal recognition particle receptor subunit beta